MLAVVFGVVDDVLRQGVQGISDLVVQPGIVNVDFADIRAIMHDAGSALMGIGLASGEERAMEAARAEINSPLLDISIDGARGVLFSVAGGDDLAMSEINDAAKIITDSINPDAKVIFGAVIDQKIKKGAVKVTVIATGFSDLPTGSAELNFDTSRESNSINGNGDDGVRGENSVKMKVKREERENKKESTQAQNKNTDDDDEEEDWDIPAFIRRKMK